MLRRILTTSVTCPQCKGAHGWPDYYHRQQCDVCIGNLEVWFLIALWWHYDARVFEPEQRCDYCNEVADRLVGGLCERCADFDEEQEWLFNSLWGFGS